MSSFSDMLETDLPIIFADSGDVATFTPATGAAVPDCHVFIDYESAAEPAGHSVKTHQDIKIIEYLKSETGREAAVGETFTVDGVVHKVLTRLAPEDALTGRAVVT